MIIYNRLKIELIRIILEQIKVGLLNEKSIRQNGYKINSIKCNCINENCLEYSIVCEIVENFRDRNRPNIVCRTNLEFSPVAKLYFDGDDKPINVTIYVGEGRVYSCTLMGTRALSGISKAKIFGNKIKGEISRVILKAMVS